MMASTLQDELLASFAAAAGGAAPDLYEAQAAEYLQNLLSEILAEAAAAQARAPQSATAMRAESRSANAGSSTAVTVLKSGFGILPLIGALAGLFGGGGSDAPEPLVKYAMPAPLRFEAAETDWGLSSVDFDQFGMARPYQTEPASRPALSGSGDGNGGAAGERNSAAPHITVNVQAMDARSFLDRSGDIAAAVRNAMLNLNSINDVVNDL